MTYKKAKKIFPGNWSMPLNGWYQNVGEETVGGPTSVLSVPGWRYFQTYGYAVVADTDPATATKVFDIIVPSPYKNDDTREDLSRLIVNASATDPSFVYRVSLSVGDDWLSDGDQAGSRKSAPVFIPSGARLSLGPDNAGAPLTNVGREAAYAELAVTTGPALATQVAEGVGSIGAVPLMFQTPSGIATTQQSFHRLTADTRFRVFVKDTAASTAVSSNAGATITAADKAAGRRGYLLCEICYIKADRPVAFNDLDPYIKYSVHSPVV